jgi:hypothetical protein
MSPTNTGSDENSFIALAAHHLMVSDEPPPKGESRIQEVEWPD